MAAGGRCLRTALAIMRSHQDRGFDGGGLLLQSLSLIPPPTYVAGGSRLVINLTNLSGYFTLTKFKIETVSSVPVAIRKGDMILFDLKDAYFWILIHLDS